MALLGRFILNDYKLIRRDRFLVMMAAMGLLIAVLMRYLLPWANVYLADVQLLPGDATDNHLSHYYPMLVSYIGLLQSGLLAGAIFGFVFLDEKDGHTLEAIRVTPVPFSSFMAARLIVPTVISWVLSIIMIVIMGEALLSFWQLLIIAASASLFAPTVVLFYAIAADNKVQGFAMAKFVAIAGWIVIGAWFLPEPYQWLCALFPPFLAHKAYWMAEAGMNGWWEILVASFLYQSAVILLMHRYFLSGLQK